MEKQIDRTGKKENKWKRYWLEKGHGPKEKWIALGRIFLIWTGRQQH